MKKWLLFTSIFFSLHMNANAANLMQVYQQALMSDQIFRLAIEQNLSDNQGVPISLSSLLPSANIVAYDSITKSQVSGGGASIVGPNTLKDFDIGLTISQTVFNFAQLYNLQIANSLSKQSNAALNAAAQGLMLRVAKAYFDVLNDEDNLNYTIAAKEAYAKQLDQVTQQYNVGLKTITDVYTARASYDSSVADYIAAINTLADARENLRVITGVYYPKLSKLSDNFPYITPKPTNMESWVKIAQCQNWSIKAAQFATQAARQNIKQQFAGNLPNLQLQGSYDIEFTRLNSRGIAGSIAPVPTPEPIPTPTFALSGATHTASASGALVLNIPIAQGGYVVATTRKAQYDYRAAVAKLEQTVRETTNNTRQSYLNILSGISKIKADKQAIKSTISSLEGLQAAYQVGTETLVDVLNQQQKVFEAQTQYASDRYTYVFNLLTLKSSAGTLSVIDLEAINGWLISENELSYSIKSEEEYEDKYIEHDGELPNTPVEQENKALNTAKAKKQTKYVKQTVTAQQKTKKMISNQNPSSARAVS